MFSIYKLLPSPSRVARFRRFAIFAACVNERPLPARTAIAILTSVRWSS